MRRNGTWDTDIELQALCSLLRCNIFVYTNVATRDGSYRWVKLEPNPALSSVVPIADAQVFSIHLYHVDGNHFAPVLDL